MINLSTSIYKIWISQTHILSYCNINQQNHTQALSLTTRFVTTGHLNVIITNITQSSLKHNFNHCLDMDKVVLEKTKHTTPCLCAIVSALALSPLMPSQPFEFASSSVMLVWRKSICSLQALTKMLTCRRRWWLNNRGVKMVGSGYRVGLKQVILSTGQSGPC